MYGKDGAPKLEGVDTDFGVRMISCRNAGDGLTYLRVSNFVMPCYGFVPTGGLKGNSEGYTIMLTYRLMMSIVGASIYFFGAIAPSLKMSESWTAISDPTTARFATFTTTI